MLLKNWVLTYFKRDPLIIIFCYLLAWGGLLFSFDSLFWDDWFYFNQPHIFLQHFTEAGFPWIGFFSVFILPQNSFSYHSISFILWLISSLLFRQIINKIPSPFNLSQFETLIGSIVFAVSPLVLARHSLAIIYPAIFLFLFILGYVLLITKSRSNLLFIIGLFFFFVSFNLNSLLLFFYFFILHYFFVLKKTNISTFKFYLKITILLVLPLLYFIPKNIFFQPYGVFEGYNSFSIFSLWGSYFTIFAVLAVIALFIFLLLITNYSQFLHSTLITLVHLAFFLLVISPLIYIFFDSEFSPLSFLNLSLRNLIIIFTIFSITLIYLVLSKQNILLFYSNVQYKVIIFYLLLSINLFIFALLPYILIGRNPFSSFSEWDTRSTILLLFFMPIGIITLYKVLNVLSDFGSKFVIFFFVLAMILTSSYHSVWYYSDWKKQQNLLKYFYHNFLHDSEVALNISDQTLNLNIFNRNYRPYEWEGQIKFALDNYDLQININEANAESSSGAKIKSLTIINQCENKHFLYYIRNESCLVFKSNPE